MQTFQIDMQSLAQLTGLEITGRRGARCDWILGLATNHNLIFYASRPYNPSGSHVGDQYFFLISTPA